MNKSNGHSEAKKPKIIAPIVEKTTEEILKQVKKAEVSKCDVIEWRIDFFEQLGNSSRVIEVTQQMKEITNKALLVTYRTKNEGGEKEVSEKSYVETYEALIKSGQIDFIDIELLLEFESIQYLIDEARKKEIKIIMSNHDFKSTPHKNEIIRRLKLMADKGADVCKIAVMPQTSEDVLTLLEATILANKEIQTPIISISMGDMGKISRISGESFGSVATFGSLNQTSAIGQIPIGVLYDTLEVLHQNN